MILSFAILFGFQGVIKEKIFSFGSHLEITKFTFGNSFVENPISTTREVYENPEKFGFVEHIQRYSYKPGLLKANDEVMGVVLKGIGDDFNLQRFEQNITEGEFITFNDSSYSREIVLSQIIADKLKLSVGDRLTMHFFQDPPRVRRLTVKGIYETWIEDFDKKVIIGDISMIQRLNNWPDSLAGGFEVFIDDFSNIAEVEEELYAAIDGDLYVDKVNDKYQEVFEWLALIEQNLNIFLGLVLFVACFNMVSVIFILIMERTQMIGILKALGAPNKLIRQIFSYNGMILIAKGLMIGNLIGLGIAFLQDQFRIIPLDPENYYMSYVPISWHWDVIILVNILVFVVVSLVLSLPTIIISRIQPIKSIRFD